jgi:Cu(I)/Ag(I) efflux system protein CusF
MKLLVAAIAAVFALITSESAIAETVLTDRGAVTLSSASGVLAAPVGYPVTLGEVRKVDLSAGTITIRHGEILHLEMPPMTMIFRVANRDLLDSVSAGQKIRFVADKQNGQYLVLWIEII